MVLKVDQAVNIYIKLLQSRMNHQQIIYTWIRN